MVLLTRYIGRTGIPAFEEGAVLINPTASPGWKFAVIAFLSHKSALPRKMVHADASNFGANVTKEEAYKQVLEQAEGLFDGQRNWVCNLANTASLLWHAYHSLPSPSSAVNWAGFYTLDPSSATRQQLILGPFQGKVACQTIAFGRGVCGAAAAQKQTQLVADVDMFPGHIACDADSRSEVVVPVLDSEGQLRAIIDVDCALPDGFDEVDRVWLESLAALVGRSCDW
ncbi:hypothetical protein MCOR07_011723 [Pyricularia oryzae]|nr:hypothetical protein MCOR07_011723 [Pyricularia oryzae]